MLVLCRPCHAGDVIALVSDAAGKPVADAVVFIYEVPGGKFAPPEASVVLDQVDKEFVPHVLPVLVGAKVKFPNKDQIHHHIYSFSKVKKFEVPLYKGEDADPVLMDKPGVIKLGCNIHDWMLGYVFVADNPYFAKTGADGKAVLSGVPDGSYEVAVWSERMQGLVEETRQKAVVGKETARLHFKLQLKLKPARKRHGY